MANYPIKDQIDMANWVRDLCLRFGVPVGTAYKVAGVFVEGLEREGYWDTDKREISDAT